MPVSVPQYNIRDTKKYYSELNKMALKGMEIITFNANNENEKVSHIKTSYLDQLLVALNFKPSVELDEKLGRYTVSLYEVDLYGEGATPDEAAEDLVTSIIQFLAIYIDKIDLFSKAESETKQLYLLKLLRCNGDKEIIKKEIGF